MGRRNSVRGISQPIVVNAASKAKATPTGGNADAGRQPVKPGGELFLAALNNPLQEPLKIYPVSNLVNSPKMDDPRCIEPVRIGLATTNR